MNATKDEIADMIRELPEEASIEDIQYHLYVLEKIRNGQAAIRDGEGVRHEDAKARLSKWLTA